MSRVIAKLRCLLAAIVLLPVAGWASAAPVEAVALFKDRAVVRTAQGQEMLKLGETSATGVTLLEASTAGAKVSYQGRIYRLGLSGRVASRFMQPTHDTVRINSDEYGQYRMRGALNGHYVNFLVDTGASLVSLSERHALGMGLDFRGLGRRGTVATAQGTAGAYFLVLDSVTLGAITLENVAATVIEGSYPVDVLLGMSFLEKVRLADDGGVLTLTAKY